MSEIEVPLKPLGREDIQKLEAVLLLGTVSRKDVIEKMRSEDPKDRITWIDSLAVAAGALAREKAGMNVSRIADELGRGEQTIRAHLTGKTEAGKLVRETYEMLLKGEKVLTFIFKETEISSKEEIEKLKNEIEKERKEKNELQEKLSKMQNKLENTIKALEQILSQLKA
ncbi:MAG: transcriptional regulator [Candidatus Methanomethylicota archaeon]|jgi:probable regulatory domain-containing protein|uniref:Transcriptional regulator n=1 Tax=Thermoproteota archaeon TaxID=2056631 RepID=A0A523BAA0_9CREN|nr:MAG: transcriptional regulator [Candidatus Verstraetearchaeota archaeon]TDA37869.1 MAG: transcriptional regulator [Candidatus Verstraetearchaeota archaeon]